MITLLDGRITYYIHYILIAHKIFSTIVCCRISTLASDAHAKLITSYHSYGMHRSFYFSSAIDFIFKPSRAHT